MEKEYEDRIEYQIISDKEAKIKRLEGKLVGENSLIAFLQQENMQLKVNQMIQDK